MKVALVNNFKTFTVDAEFTPEAELEKFYRPIYGGRDRNQRPPLPNACLSFRLGDELIKIETKLTLMGDNQMIRVFNKGTDGRYTISLEYLKVDHVSINLINNTIQFYYRSLACDRDGVLLPSDMPLRYRRSTAFSGSVYEIIKDDRGELFTNPFRKGFHAEF